jgi:hypothetical protein
MLGALGAFLLGVGSAHSTNPSARSQRVPVVPMSSQRGCRLSASARPGHGCRTGRRPSPSAYVRTASQRPHETPPAGMIVRAQGQPAYQHAAAKRYRRNRSMARSRRAIFNKWICSANSCMGLACCQRLQHAWTQARFESSNEPPLATPIMCPGSGASGWYLPPGLCLSVGSPQVWQTYPSRQKIRFRLICL